MFTTVIASSQESDFVELGATRQGRLFKKHILNKGTLFHPKTGESIDINDDFITKLKANYDSGVCPIVQVPLADAQNAHSEAPDRNIGVVTGIEEEDGKVYALIDARKHADDLGKTMLGASAMMSLDYTDTKTKTKVGPTLLHVAITNRPFVTDLEDFSEVVAASSDYSSEDTVLLTPTAATKEPEVMTKEEMIAALKAEHGVDVAAIETENATLKAAPPAVVAPTAPDASLTALTKTLADAGLVTLSDGQTIGMGDVVNAMAHLATNNVQLSATVETMVTERKTAEVDRLVETGFILPAERDARVELKLSNEELFAKLLPAQPIVKLSEETGVVPETPAPTDLDAEIARYIALGTDRGFIKSATS